MLQSTKQGLVDDDMVHQEKIGIRWAREEAAMRPNEAAAARKSPPNGRPLESTLN